MEAWHESVEEIKQLEEQVAFWKRELKLEQARADFAEEEIAKRDAEIARLKAEITNMEAGVMELLKSLEKNALEQHRMQERYNALARRVFEIEGKKLQ